jgi:aspartyl-tRNA(Asn)/glutamyl-tRNA(Gln) amidotransferase subunit C
MNLSNDEIKHIADLARLELTEAELEKYGLQISGILSYIDQLAEVDTDDVPPTAQVTGLSNALREDEAVDWDDGERQMALEQAPGFEDGQVKVKRVL